MIETWDFDIKKVFFAKKSGAPLRNFWVIFLKNSIFEKPKKPTFSQPTSFSRIEFWKNGGIGRGGPKIVLGTKHHFSIGVVRNFCRGSPPHDFRPFLRKTQICLRWSKNDQKSEKHFHMGKNGRFPAGRGRKCFWWPNGSLRTQLPEILVRDLPPVLLDLK